MRIIGLAATIVYAALIVWVYGQQPRTVAQVTGGMAAGLGAYYVDERSSAEALQFFRNNQFIEARAAFARADPAERDPTTQFYIAYSYYREGWGRFYHSDLLYQKGLETIERAIAIAPDGRIVVSDENLRMRSADELRGELLRGLERDVSDFNPLKVFRERK
jgi:tetratricopeptide (TPR) repeat protein